MVDFVGRVEEDEPSLEELLTENIEKLDREIERRERAVPGANLFAWAICWLGGACVLAALGALLVWIIKFAYSMRP